MKDLLGQEITVGSFVVAAVKVSRSAVGQRIGQVVEVKENGVVVQKWEKRPWCTTTTKTWWKAPRLVTLKKISDRVVVIYYSQLPKELQAEDTIRFNTSEPTSASMDATGTLACPEPDYSIDRNAPDRM